MKEGVVDLKHVVLRDVVLDLRAVLLGLLEEGWLPIRVHLRRSTTNCPRPPAESQYEPGQELTIKCDTTGSRSARNKAR